MSSDVVIYMLTVFMIVKDVALISMYIRMTNKFEACKTSNLVTSTQQMADLITTVQQMDSDLRLKINNGK